jgi:hypothetical protein
MADVSSTLPSWSTTASSNGPSGSTTIGTGMDDNLREIQAVVRAWMAHKGADIASATTTDIGAVAGSYHDITGTTTITGLGTVSAGIGKVLKFEGALTLTHNATSLILPGGANITTADGDTAAFISEGSGNWRCVWYQKANGQAVVASTLTTTAPRLLENIGLAVTMAANAVTVALKGADGNDPSSSNKVGIGFRNATLTNGQASKVEVTAATSVAISSGSTGGTVSGEASRIWIAAINNGGTVELAWFNARSGTSIAPINEGGLISTTAEGGAGGADSAQTWYSTTARSNVPVTVLGYFDSTQATAGTWASSPANVVVNPKHRPNDVVQEPCTFTGAHSSGAVAIPYDNTIPQNTEGTQYMTQAITPTAAANLLDIEAQGVFGSASGAFCMALFQDSTANAIGSVRNQPGTAQPDATFPLRHRMLAGTTSSTTFKIRAGENAGGTVNLNGASGAGIDGGVLRSYMSVKEIMV